MQYVCDDLFFSSQGGRAEGLFQKISLRGLENSLRFGLVLVMIHALSPTTLLARDLLDFQVSLSKAL